MMLHTERATREGARAFVRYDDLLTDWTIPVFRLGQELDLEAVKAASANGIRKVHQFMDPDLKRVQTTWDDVAVPARLREIAEETWRGARQARRARRRHPRRARAARRGARGVRRVLRRGRGASPSRA